MCGLLRGADVAGELCSSRGARWLLFKQRLTSPTSRQDLVDHAAAEVGEAVVAAVVAVGEFFVIEAEEVEEGGVEVIHVDFVFDGFVAELIGGAVVDAGFDAAAGHPNGKTFGIVIAADAALGV